MQEVDLLQILGYFLEVVLQKMKKKKKKSRNMR